MLGSPLALDLAGTPAQLVSSVEVNTLPTAFDPKEPDFAGYKGRDNVKTTSDVTVGGVYTGLTDEVYTFTVHRHREVPDSRETKFDVFDASGASVGLIAMPADHPPDTPWETPYGVTLSFTEGKLVYGETFTLNLHAVSGSRAEPDNPFSGTGASDPNLEPGLSVGPGRFTVNGVTIDVGADDTITSVLERLSASGAGVVGWYDDATDRVTLQSLDGDTDIVLGGDDSGLLAALKLTDAVVSGGMGSDLERPIGQIPALAGITAGSFRLNDTVFQVDPATDTLQGVLDRITDALPQVEARYVAADGAVELFSAGAPLIVVDGDSGFFSALGIDDGLHGPPPMKKPLVRKIVSQAKLLGRKLEELADREGGQAREQILQLIARTLGPLVPDVDPMHHGTLSTAFLNKAAERDPDALLTALAGDPGEHGRGGLVGDVLTIVGAAEMSRVEVVVYIPTQAASGSRPSTRTATKHAPSPISRHSHTGAPNPTGRVPATMLITPVEKA